MLDDAPRGRVQVPAVVRIRPARISNAALPVRAAFERTYRRATVQEQTDHGVPALGRVSVRYGVHHAIFRRRDRRTVGTILQPPALDEAVNKRGLSTGENGEFAGRGGP